MQEDKEGTNHPVCFASRSLTMTERKYAQIEKEMLAITWACEKFEKYLIGLQFRVDRSQTIGPYPQQKIHGQFNAKTAKTTNASDAF